MTEPADQGDQPRPEMVPSGIAGLDTILKGGFLAGGVYIIQGNPGTGKTILGNQLCFNHVAAGGKVLYVTLLAENHSRMFLHIGRLAFFDPSVIPAKLYYISAFRILEEEGLRGLRDLLRREVQAHRASVVVLDGLVAAEEMADSPREFRKFIHELQTQAAFADCTVFLLTGMASAHPPPEHTMVDGIIELAQWLDVRRPVRDLEVIKRRGLGYLRGRHSFRITDAGLVLFPRIEALLARPTQEDHVEGKKVPTGIARLDEMLGGGLPDDSTTMLIGPSGSGKTTLGLQFLASASAEEPGLFFGLFETPARLRIKARSLGLPVGRLLDQGHVEILWHSATAELLDEVGNRLVEAVRRRGVRRLFLDGYSGLEKLALEPVRLNRFIAALTLELRALGVTTIFTSEIDLTGTMAGSPVSGVSLPGISDIVENIILLRFIELRTELHRCVSVIKVRDGDFDPAMRGYIITKGGLAVDDGPERADAILIEAARQAGRPALPNTRSSRRRRED